MRRAYSLHQQPIQIDKVCLEYLRVCEKYHAQEENASQCHAGKGGQNSPQLLGI